MNTQRQQILKLIQEYFDAYEICMQTGGHPNADFAGYVSEHGLDCFRHVLKRPDLTRVELSVLVRNALGKQSGGGYKQRRSDWAPLVAGHVSREARASTAYAQ